MFDRPLPDRTKMLAIATIGLFLTVPVWLNSSAVLPIIVEDWDLTGTRAGIIFGAFQAGYMLAIIPMGVLSDRYTATYVIGVGAFITGLMSVAFALVATGFLSGTAFRFVGGMAMAGVYVPGMRFVSDWYPPERRGRAIGVFVGAFSLSGGLSFALTAGIADVIDWRTAIAVTSVGGLLAGPLVAVTGREKAATDSANGRSLSLDLSLLKNRSYLTAVSIYSWHNWELLGVRNWLLAFLVTVPAVTATDSGILAGGLVGAMMAIGGVGNLVGGWLSDRIGRPQTIALALASSAGISLSIVAFRGAPLWMLTAVLLVYGIVLTADSAPTSTAVTEVVPDEQVGTALSIQSFVGFSTTVVSPVVFGLALDRSGFTIAFWTLAFGAVLGLVSTGVLYRLTRTRD